MLFFTIIIFTWLYIYLAFQKKFWTLCPSLFFLHIPVICLLYGNSDEYTIYMCLYSFTKSEFYTSLFEFLLYNVHTATVEFWDHELKIIFKIETKELTGRFKGVWSLFELKISKSHIRFSLSILIYVCYSLT